MPPAAIPENERERLAALRRYDILDTPPEPAFDELTRLAAYICGTPMSLVTFVDAERQWFKSNLGMKGQETPRDVAFCAHALQEPQLLIVGDARADRRFADNPLVTGDPNIRFYAGAPLTTDDGYALGTLCVIDQVPRTLRADQEDALRALGRQAVLQLELRRRLEDLHQAYAHLETFDRLRSEFVGMVSHELRTPLTSIRGALQLALTDEQGLTGDTRELLSSALHSAERLSRLTDDILDMSRLEAGAMRLEPRQQDLRDVVRHAVDGVKHAAGAAERLRVDVPAKPVLADVDADRIVQAVVNLTGNALKFGAPGTPVTVTVTAPVAGRARIAVTDHGPGIAPGDIARLFHPFAQLANARNMGGTGLGLVITKGIVEQHGGSLLVDSTPGEGTTFTIVLPV